jgi:hypothetical protein
MGSIMLFGRNDQHFVTLRFKPLDEFDHGS